MCLVWAFLVIAGLAVAQETETLNMTDSDLQAQHKGCTARKNDGQESCASQKSCCYYEYFDAHYDSHVPVCTGINVFRQLIAKNDLTYLKRLNMSNLPSYIRTSSFCSIITVDPLIPEVRECKCDSGVLIACLLLLVFMALFYM